MAPLGKSYPYAEVQSMHSNAPADRAVDITEITPYKIEALIPSGTAVTTVNNGGLIICSIWIIRTIVLNFIVI